MKLLLCQNCHLKPVEISYTHIQNGQREDYVLCNECAKKLHMNEKFNLGKSPILLHDFMLIKPSVENKNSHKSAISENSKKEQKNSLNQGEINILNTKILALTLEKERAVAKEDYSEAARLKKLIDQFNQKNQDKLFLHIGRSFLQKIKVLVQCPGKYLFYYENKKNRIYYRPKHVYGPCSLRM